MLAPAHARFGEVLHPSLCFFPFKMNCAVASNMCYMYFSANNVALCYGLLFAVCYFCVCWVLIEHTSIAEIALCPIVRVLLCIFCCFVFAIIENEIVIPDATLKGLRNIVPKLEKNRGYRGRGGEHVRSALCEVIAMIAIIPFKIMKLEDKAIDRYQKTIDENLCIPFDFVQNSALKALKNISKNYYAMQNTANDDKIYESRMKNITLKWCEKLKNEKIASITRGYSRGLGVLSKNLILAHLQVVIDVLISKSLLTANADSRDFETRKNCCLALADLVCNENDNCGIGIDYYQDYYKWNEKKNLENNDELDEKKLDENGNDATMTTKEEEDELARLGLLDITREDKSSMNKNLLKIEDEIFIYRFDVDDRKKENKNESTENDSLVLCLICEIAFPLIQLMLCVSCI